MAKNLIYVRVLQHDTEDQIRIGMSTPIWESNLEKAVADVKAEYEKNLAGFGGFEEGCKRFYKRVALVDANTLAVIKIVYEKKV